MTTSTRFPANATVSANATANPHSTAPARTLDVLWNQLAHSLAQSAFPALGDWATTFTTGGLPLSVWRTEDDVVVEIDLPGVAEADLDLSFHEGKLTIAGERRPADLPETAQVVWSNRPSGKFEQVLTLSDDIDGDTIRAHLEHGVLRLTMNRRPESKPKKIGFTPRQS